MVEATPLTDITAASVTEAFYCDWVTHFGVLATVVTDQGRQFEADLFRELSLFLGFKWQHTTAYHSQANEMVEQFHHTLMAVLMATLQGTPQWSLAQHTILLGLHTSPTMT